MLLFVVCHGCLACMICYVVCAVFAWHLCFMLSVVCGVHVVCAASFVRCILCRDQVLLNTVVTKHTTHATHIIHNTHYI